MALSTCIKCGSSSFELKEAPSVNGARFKYHFVQCNSCGGVVGVLEYNNIGLTLEKLAQKLGVDLND